jgi:hypothetical protein
MEVGFQFFSHASRYETEKPYELFLDKLPSEIPSSNCEFVRRVVKLQDIRSTTLRPRLEVEGFRVVNDNSIGLNGVSDLLDDSKLQEYLDKTIELVKRECGSSKVICYDWRVSTAFKLWYICSRLPRLEVLR